MAYPEAEFLPPQKKEAMPFLTGKLSPTKSSAANFANSREFSNELAKIRAIRGKGVRICFLSPALPRAGSFQLGGLFEGLIAEVKESSSFFLRAFPLR